MADLVCVAFDDPTTADRALTELTALQKEYVIELKDACVVVRLRWGGPPPPGDASGQNRARSPAARRARFGAP